MRKTSIFNEWLFAWKLIWKKGWYVPASAVLDVLFLVLYGFMTSQLFDKLTEHVIVIGTLLTEQMRAVADRTRPAIIDALFQPPVSRYTWQFVALLVILAIVVFVLFCVFQGLAWFIAARLTGSRTHWRKYLLVFARINLLWAGLYFFWQVADTVFNLRRVAVEKITGQIIAGSGIVMQVLLAVLIYFAIVSYALLGIRKAFVVGTRKIIVLLPAVVIVCLQFFICNYFLIRLAEISPKLSFIITAIVLVLLLAWTRAYATIVVRQAAHV
ncbi:MAG: hypothetical protein QXR48_01045 [Candidatus Woesearchaeota archaeon]